MDRNTETREKGLTSLRLSFMTAKTDLTFLSMETAKLCSVLFDAIFVV
jgi:hypothetical protein